MSQLFSPLKIKDVTLRNRIGVAPMCQYSSIDGVAQPWHMVHIGSRAVGGAGLIIAEATAICPEGRISPGCAGLWNDKQVEALTPIVQFQKDMGAVPGIQIGHAGRKGSAARPWDGGAHLANEDGGWDTVSSSADVFDPDGTRLWKEPTALSVAGIATIKAQFVESAKRALAAGYQFLEIHGAHGYLLHSFLTPLVNNRTDIYGVDLAGRARFLLETVQAVRDVWPENLPLGVRLSAHDWIDGGHGIEENIQIAKWVQDCGVDVVDCSGGGATPAARASIGERTSDQVKLAAQMRTETGLITAAVGYITDAVQAEAIVANGMADIALLGREMLRDPYWPMHAAQSLGVDAKAHTPVQNHVIA